jgi:hypothetical protein
MTLRILLILAKRLASKVLTLELFRAIGLTIRTIRMTLKLPVLIGMNGISISMIRIKTASRAFQPPSSELEKNAGFPSGYCTVLGETPEGTISP